MTTAAATDITTGKIRNRLIVLGILSGFLFRIWESGIVGLLLSVIQIVFPVIVLFLLFLMRALGAGDIKLFSMIGSIWNFKILLYCIVWSFFTGAVLSLIKLLYHRNLIARLKYFLGYTGRCFLAKRLLIYREPSDGKQNTISFSIAVLSGFLVTMGVMM